VRHVAAGRAVVTLRGGFPRDCTASTQIHVLDRDEYIARAIRGAWTRLGGIFEGRVREGRTPEGSSIVAEHRSRALAEVVRDIAKRSDNPVTRITWLTLGALAEGSAASTTAERSQAVVRHWLSTRGIPADGLVLENGSGLSRLERIAPRTLAGTVAAAMQSPWWLEFAASLPIAAVDGGMRTRLVDTPAAANARIKTGTLRDTWGVAGYVDVEGRGRYVVVAMINDPAARAADARATLDTLVAWVASGAPAP
jgi:D-alanyl-D-alanine carboxypeptidase/D-alanyl-D-alanine-endopeptidase (penicillin-binding protein 4)